MIFLNRRDLKKGRWRGAASSAGSQPLGVGAHELEQRGTNTCPDVELPARRQPDGMEESEVRGR